LSFRLSRRQLVVSWSILASLGLLIAVLALAVTFLALPSDRSLRTVKA
jgi:hypothetical protein